MSASYLVLSAPTRRARGFADASDTLISVDFYQKERRKGVRATAPATNRKFRVQRNADGNGFDPGDFQAATLTILRSRPRKPSRPARYPLKIAFLFPHWRGPDDQWCPSS